MLNINVDRTDGVLFVKDSEERPAVIAKVAHIGADIQERANYVDEPIRDIGNAADLPSAVDELFFCLNNAKRFAKFYSFLI
jgi:hypothetical protein